MYVSVGYCDNPDTTRAGRIAAEDALKQASGKNLPPCDMALVFATARHDAATLRASIATVIGENTPIYGGAAVGAISNNAFGYAGDQIILALFWVDNSSIKVVTEPGLNTDEAKVGEELGKKLAKEGINKDSSVMLFYDAIDRSSGDFRMVMATYLLEGMRNSLGFLPNMTGAGLQGDYINSPTKQLLGNQIAQHSALAMAFEGSVHIDSVIMHGCRPATGYYTVTKTDGQTILEINNQPALPFICNLLGGALQPENLPFFLILGVNRGDKWAPFNEASYANRLCLGIDKERNGIIMFEPDMTPGCEFQIMYRTLESDYIAPRIDNIFEQTQDREPIFAMYINCAGRAAGYGGVDIEDAIAVQKAVNNRVPLLGIYTGVEIAPVEGMVRGLDWTGVFCLFSVPK